MKQTDIYYFYAGSGFDQPDLGSDVPAHGREAGLDDLQRSLSSPKHLMIL